MNAAINHFADLECKAIAIREKRFYIADQIRFIQDTLMHFAKKEDSKRLINQLQSLNREKEIVLQKSMYLADTIRIQLDSVINRKLTTPTDKKLFNQRLDSALKKRGCAKFN